MERLDQLMIGAGQIIHFQGIPVCLSQNITVLGNKKNFKVDESGYFIVDSILGEPQTAQGTSQKVVFSYMGKKRIKKITKFAKA